MTKGYEKLDSIKVDKSHIVFVDNYVKDMLNKNKAVDIFPPMFSIEDTIISFISMSDIKDNGKVMKKLIENNLGKDNFQFREIVKEKFKSND